MGLRSNPLPYWTPESLLCPLVRASGRITRPSIFWWNVATNILALCLQNTTLTFSRDGWTREAPVHRPVTVNLQCSSYVRVPGAATLKWFGGPSEMQGVSKKKGREFLKPLFDHRERKEYTCMANSVARRGKSLAFVFWSRVRNWQSTPFCTSNDILALCVPVQPKYKMPIRGLTFVCCFVFR